MITTTRICALTLALTAGIACAQEGESSPQREPASWGETAIARCLEQYSSEQCQDPEFLEENFHVNSLEIAHRAAIRRNQEANRAMREVILQYACNGSADKVCTGNDSAHCRAEIQQTCATLKHEANACIQFARQGCASTSEPSACMQQQVAKCPSMKKQPVAQLLAKYPKLSASQKSKLAATAQALEEKTGGWWSNLRGWLINPFN